MSHSREIVIIGGGPAGLSAAIEAAELGAEVLVIDENNRPGGQLFKQIHKFFGSKAHNAGVRGMDIGRYLLEETQRLNVEVWLGNPAVGVFAGGKVAVLRGGVTETITAQKILVCTGAVENAVHFPGWTLPGVMGAGAAQTMVNINRVLPGRRVLMVGSGNVGVIVSYQLMQAGAEVVGILEGMPRIGAYGVHAAKIRRAGVPFFPRAHRGAGPGLRPCRTRGDRADQGLAAHPRHRTGNGCGPYLHRRGPAAPDRARAHGGRQACVYTRDGRLYAPA